MSHYEGHLAEVLWRSEGKGNLYGPCFDPLKTVYRLNGPPTYTYGFHLFDSCEVVTLNHNEWEAIPQLPDDDDDDQVPPQVEQTPEVPSMSAASQGSEILVTSGESSIVCGQAADSKKQQDFLRKILQC